MKYLYIDAIGGAAGDMLLGALLDKFVPFDHFQQKITLLALPDYSLSLEQTAKHQISARKFSAVSRDKTHRHLKDIVELINQADLGDWVKKESIAVFQKLGEQEAEIHQVPVEKIHFHEVGAVDSIIDIVGFFICLEYLKPDTIYTSPLPVSGGIVSAGHGKLPVPAPATLAFLKNYPLKYLDVEGELVTPTGALLMSHVSDGQLPLHLPFTISEIGYGAGSKDFKEVPNLLRIWSGEIESNVVRDNVFQIETNIDDMNPEIYPHLQSMLLENGALDVSLYQGIMKKGRPGILISVLANAENLSSVREILYRETSTIGFRYFPVFREKLPRRLKTIESPWGKIKVKEVAWESQTRWLPEYEECKRIAGKTGESVLSIYQQVQTYLANHSRK